MAYLPVLFTMLRAGDLCAVTHEGRDPFLVLAPPASGQAPLVTDLLRLPVQDPSTGVRYERACHPRDVAYVDLP